MFGNHWSGASGDIAYLICHVTSKDHVIKDHVMLWDGSPHVSWHPTKFGGHNNCSRGDILILVCHVKLCDGVPHVALPPSQVW